MSDREHDLVVIGAGAAGLATARAAARDGARTLLIHEGRIGGDCTFTGCVPSKTLLEATGRGASFRDAFAAVHRAIEVIASKETPAVLRAEGIDVVHGRATFHGPNSLDVDGTRVDAPRVVIATGAGPAVPSIDGLRGVPFLTNENVFDLTEQPASLAVLGGGAIGCELAQAFRRLGSEVTIIEALPRLLPKEEPLASRVIATVFLQEGITIRTGARVARVEPENGTGRVSVHFERGAPVRADRVLVAVGRVADTHELGLDRAGVETDERGFIRTEDTLKTTAARIWAAGDVAGKVQFTHAADEMGRIAAANALHRLRRVVPRKFRSDWIPSVTYTQPEVARIGLIEDEAVERGGRVAYVPMRDVDRAITSGATAGFVKLLAGPRPVLRNTGGGQVVGATIVAARAGEMIHEAALAMRTRMLTGRLAQTVHAYPTWSTALRQAAAQFFVETDGRTARPARRDADADADAESL